MELNTAKMLHDQDGIHIGVVDCWSIRPMDMACLQALFEKETTIITIEEGELIGGFGSEIARLCAEHGAKSPAAILGLPNRFIAHGTVNQLLEECGMTPAQLAQSIREALKRTEKSYGG